MSDKDNIVEINSMDELEDVTEEHENVIVDFFAEWCGPCEMMEPTIEEIADEEDVIIAEVDIDDNQDIAAEFGVRSVPTYIFFNDGEPADQKIGYQEKEDMVASIGS